MAARARPSRQVQRHSGDRQREGQDQLHPGRVRVPGGRAAGGAGQRLKTMHGRRRAQIEYRMAPHRGCRAGVVDEGAGAGRQRAGVGADDDAAVGGLAGIEGELPAIGVGGAKQPGDADRAGLHQLGVSGHARQADCGIHQSQRPLGLLIELDTKEKSCGTWDGLSGWRSRSGLRWRTACGLKSRTHRTTATNAEFLPIFGKALRRLAPR